jgi:hypothetical protein
VGRIYVKIPSLQVQRCFFSVKPIFRITNVKRPKLSELIAEYLNRIKIDPGATMGQIEGIRLAVNKWKW